MSLLPLLLCLLQHVTGTTSLEQAFFNQSSLVTLPATATTMLDPRSHIAFSFRTCTASSSSGESSFLVEQRGGNGDVLGFKLSEEDEGRLRVYWTAKPDASSDVISDAVVLDQTPSLLDNQWYTVDWNFDLGEIFVSVERGAHSVERILLANSTYRRFLWDLDLSGGEGVKVGSGFVGCLQGGPGIELAQDTAGLQQQDVTWGQCPLDQPQAAAQQCGELIKIFS